MKKYVLHIKGHSEGCDYTISCNETVKTVRAANWHAAVEEARGLLKDKYGYPDDTNMELYGGITVTMYEVSQEGKLPTDEWEAELTLETEKAEAAAKEEEERAAYELLKAKFEK